MRNQLAISVLDRDMLYLMDALATPEELASSIDHFEHTSILTDIFCNVNLPFSEITDLCMGRRRRIGKITKHLISRVTREDPREGPGG